MGPAATFLKTLGMKGAAMGASSVVVYSFNGGLASNVGLGILERLRGSVFRSPQEEREVSTAGESDSPAESSLFRLLRSLFGGGNQIVRSVLSRVGRVYSAISNAFKTSWEQSGKVLGDLWKGIGKVPEKAKDFVNKLLEWVRALGTAVQKERGAEAEDAVSDMSAEGQPFRRLLTMTFASVFGHVIGFALTAHKPEPIALLTPLVGPFLAVKIVNVILDSVVQAKLLLPLVMAPWRRVAEKTTRLIFTGPAVPAE